MRKTLLFIFSFVYLSVHAQQWQWGKVIDTTVQVPFFQLIADNNSNFYFTTNYNDSTGSAVGACIFKFNTQGNELWRRKLPGNISVKGITYSNNNIYVIGEFENAIQIGNDTLSSAGLSDIFITDFTSNGNFVWAKGFGGNGNDWGNGVSADIDGNIYLTGACSSGITLGDTTYNFNSYIGVFLVKMDAIGNILFSRTFVSNYANEDCFGKKIQIDQMKNIYLLGESNSDIYFDSIHYYSYSQQDNFLCKLDTVGNVQWVDKASGYGCEIAGLDLDQSGHIYTGGSCGGNHGGENPWIVKYDIISGQYIWSKFLFPTLAYQSDILGEGIINENNNSYLIGHDWLCPTNIYCYQQFLLSKCDSAGNILFLDTINLIGTGADLYRTAIIKDSNGDFIICGSLTGNLTLGSYSLNSNRQAFIAKFSDNTNTSVNNSFLQEDINIFPNPSSGIFTVQMRNSQAGAKITVRDVLGNCLLEKNSRGETSQEINLSCQPRGIYFVELMSGDNRVVKKVAVQ